MATRATLRPPYAGTAEAEPSYKHVALASWMETATGVQVDLKSVQLALSLVSEFRATPEYQKAEAEQQARRDAAEADRLRRKAARVRERREKIAAELAKADEELAAIPVPVDEVGKKRAAKKAPAKTAPALPPAEAIEVGPETASAPAPAPAPAKKAPAKKAPAKAAPAPVANSTVLDPEDDPW